MEHEYIYPLTDFQGEVNVVTLVVEARVALPSYVELLSATVEEVEEVESCVIRFREALAVDDKNTLDAVIAAHTGGEAPEVPPTVVTSATTDGGVMRFVQELRSDSRFTAVTHNFCDPRTWFQESVRVTGETLTVVDPDRKVWASAHPFWIDMSHGRISDEDDVSGPYLPALTVNGDPQVEASPFGDGSDGDFIVDYTTGTVTFHETVETYDPVASYSYAGSSMFTIAPLSGKALRLLEAECQMSADIEMNDDLWYGVYVTIPGVGEVLVKQKRYKTIQDIINEANGAYPVIPAMGGVQRGTSQQTITFPWHYVSRTDLLSSMGMKIKIRLSNDIPCIGQGAYVAFYCVSITE